MNTKMQHTIKKIFFIIYLSMMMPHILEQNFSEILIIIFLSGIVVSYTAHKSPYRKFGILFLMFHMVIEFPHMMEHLLPKQPALSFGQHMLIDNATHQQEILLKYAHGIHILLDAILLYALLKLEYKKYFIFIYGIIIILGLGLSQTRIAFNPNTKIFVFGGIIGCILGCLIPLFRNKKQKPVL